MGQAPHFAAVPRDDTHKTPRSYVACRLDRVPSVRTFLAVAVVLVAWSFVASPSGHRARAESAASVDDAAPEDVPPAPSHTGALLPIAFAAILPGLRRRQEQRRIARAIRLGLEHHDADAGLHMAPHAGSVFASTRLPV